MKRVRRGGVYRRVCDPAWPGPCSDTQHSKKIGGRWNPKNEFGALYLCQTGKVAAANARANFENESWGLLDMPLGQRPYLLEFEVSTKNYIDAVTDGGLKVLGLGSKYPHGVGHPPCQRIARDAYQQGEVGIAARSAAGCSAPSESPGEELAIFNREGKRVPARPGKRIMFSDWYPGAS